MAKTPDPYEGSEAIDAMIEALDGVMKSSEEAFGHDPEVRRLLTAYWASTSNREKSKLADKVNAAARNVTRAMRKGEP